MESSDQKNEITVLQNPNEINRKYRHKYHAMPPFGWMNDPNGFCFYQKEYHLFYQFHPFGTTWGPMHWGHLVSKDMIRWSDLPIALVPNMQYDQQGVFSGSAFVQEGKMHVYYTGHTEVQKECENNTSLNLTQSSVRQVQCLASSMDGINFIKNPMNPIIGSDQLPLNARIEDFRDPKVWEHNKKYYMVIGSKHKEGYGQVLFYQSKDMIHWSYLNEFTLGERYGTVWECPDMFSLGGKDILLISPQEKSSEGYLYENSHSSLAIIGHFSYETGLYQMEKVQELDGGFDFYAPQTILDATGRRVMVAWMHMWERRNILDEYNHGWCGSMTFPRELHYENEVIKQTPIEAIKNYYNRAVSFENIMIKGETTLPGIVGHHIDLEFTIEWMDYFLFQISMFVSENSKLILRCDRKKQLITLDRSRTELRITSNHKEEDYDRSVPVVIDATLKLRILLDKSSAEIFINDGKQVLSGLFYSEEQGENITFHTDGAIRISQLQLYELL